MYRKSPKVFNVDEMLEPTIRAWKSIEEFSSEYIAIIAQGSTTESTAGAAIFFATQGRGAAAQPIRSAQVISMRANTTKSRGAIITVDDVLGDVMKSRALNYFSAPKLSIALRPDALATASNNWGDLERQFRYLLPSIFTRRGALCITLSADADNCVVLYSNLTWHRCAAQLAES